MRKINPYLLHSILVMLAVKIWLKQYFALAKPITFCIGFQNG